MAITTGISAGIQYFKTYNSQLLTSQQYAGMKFDSVEQVRKRKANENNEVAVEEASPHNHTSLSRDDFFDNYDESEVDAVSRGSSIVTRNTARAGQGRWCRLSLTLLLPRR